MRVGNSFKVGNFHSSGNLIHNFSMEGRLLLIVVCSLLTLGCAGVPSYDTSGKDEYRRQELKVPIDIQRVDLTKSMLANRTIVMAQPWANTKQYNINKVPIFLKANGSAYSRLWSGHSWVIWNGKLCIQSSSSEECFVANQNPADKQAYLFSENNKLYSQVIGIESGDSRRVIQAYKDRQERIRQRQQLALDLTSAVLSSLAEPACYRTYSGRVYCD